MLGEKRRAPGHGSSCISVGLKRIKTTSHSVPETKISSNSKSHFTFLRSSNYSLIIQINSADLMPPCLTLYQLDYLFAFIAAHTWMNNDPDCREPWMSRFSFHWDEPQTCGLISANTCKIIFLIAGYLVAIGAKREICPVSQHGLCAVTTLWCWGLSKKQLQHRFWLFFFLTVKHAAWGLRPCYFDRAKSTLLVWVRKITVKARNQSFLSLYMAKKCSR